MKSGLIALTFCAFGLGACGDDDPTPDTASDLTEAVGEETDGDTPDLEDAPEDAPDTPGPDTTLGDDVYGPRTPPAGEVAEPLRAAGWVSHYLDDLEPYWTMPAALGTPPGNFPTWRDMAGQPAGPERRRPRMISRQVFAYVVGFMLTGQPALLEYAAAGVAWLRDHAIDRTLGGCHPELGPDGAPIAGVRSAQDQAYCMLGLAAWVFLTRDPDAEADLIAGRDLLMDPAYFWDATEGRIKDALDATLAAEVDVDNDGGWELVAQLDPINAFMLLTQPVLASPADRERFLSDLRTLSAVIVERFHADDFIWGVHTKHGQYRSKHADFGHSMKALWMVLQVDKRLPDHPFRELVASLGDTLVARAFDADNGRWAKRPLSDSAVEFGSDWWIYAEADQLAATLNLSDQRYDDLLAQTQAHWRQDYVDRRFAGEVIPGIRRDGSPAFGWPVGDTAKCHEWKNGYHSTEHALVLTLLGGQREGDEVTLRFAVPPAEAASFIARPYIFQGREVRREPGAIIEVAGRSLQIVAVVFRDLY